MTTQPYDHIGILVSDLAEAAQRFSAALGLHREATRREPSDDNRMYTAFASGLHGIRVELSSSRRPPLLERLAALKAAAE